MPAGISRRDNNNRNSITAPDPNAYPRGKQDRGRAVFHISMFALVAALVILIVFMQTNGILQVNNPGSSSLPSGSAAGAGPSSSASAGVPVKDRPVITEVMMSNKGSITTEDGRYTDWFELYNPTAKAINLNGFAVSDNPKKPTKCMLPAYTLEPGKYVIIYADSGKSTKTELHASFSLKSSGSPLMLVDPNGIEVQSVPVPALDADFSYALGADNQWTITDKFTPGFPNTEDGYSQYIETRRAASDIAINEVMAGNTLTVRDADGDYSDFIELYNPTDKPVDITGWGLSNKESEPKRWVFPKMSIEPKQYIVIYASGKNRAEAGKELHTDFKLNALNDTVLLSNLRGQIVSEVQLNDLKPDESYARTPGTDKWQTFAHPTPGNPNDEEGWNALQPSLYGNETKEPIVINEVMSNNADTAKDQFGEYPDLIELYNRSDKAVDLKGYGLTDKANELGRWKFPDISLPAGQYLTVFASGRNLTDEDAVSKRQLHTDFAIGMDGGIVALTAPDGHAADRCFVPALRAGYSYGRLNGDFAFRYFDKPTPGAANEGGYPGLAPDPVFSIKAGSYEGKQKVELSTDDPEAKIYYTLDGSAPTASSEAYSGPIELTKTAVIRAIACRDGYLPGRVITQSYIINEKHTLPVISISTTPKNLFDPETGIYMPGPNANPEKLMEGANFYKDTEVPASFEVYDANGERVFNQDIGLCMSGGIGLIKNQKTFAIHARSEYGQSTMDYKFFDDRPYTEYKSLVLRTNRDKSKIRESVIFGLVDGKMDVVTQAYKPYVVYINGQYWGVYNLMEKRNKYMVAQHEGASDTNNINILKGSGGIISNGVNTEYKNLVNYVNTHDMSQKENYDYVAARFDTDSFMDVMINLIYMSNTDWYNMQYYQVPGGKWKQILYDTEITFQVPSNKTLEKRMESSICGSDMFNGLLKYKPWKEKFIERFAWAINEIYNTDRVNAAIDKEANAIKGEIAAMHDKFGDTATVDEWNAQIAQLHTFANQRPAAMVNQLKSAFSLTDAQKQMLDDAIQ